MTFKMSETDQTVTVYNLRSDTNEFIGSGDAFIPPHTGLPAYCTDLEPPDSREGYVAVFNTVNESWSLVEDHRGLTVYDTGTGATVYISELGPLPENVTVISPSGEFQIWDGAAWVKDEAAEKAGFIREAEEAKKSMMQVANENIEPLQDAIDLDMATDAEKALLLAWKKYRVLLMRVDTSAAPDIEWPTQPEVPAS